MSARIVLRPPGVGNGNGASLERSPTSLVPPIIMSHVDLHGPPVEGVLCARDTERLECEVTRLVDAMERDGTEVQMVSV